MFSPTGKEPPHTSRMPGAHKHSLEQGLAVGDFQGQAGHLEAQINCLEQELATAVSTTLSLSSQPDTPVWSDAEEEEAPPLWAHPVIRQKVEHEQSMGPQGRAPWWWNMPLTLLIPPLSCGN